MVSGVYEEHNNDRAAQNLAILIIMMRVVLMMINTVVASILLLGSSTTGIIDTVKPSTAQLGHPSRPSLMLFQLTGPILRARRGM